MSSDRHAFTIFTHIVMVVMIAITSVVVASVNVLVGVTLCSWIGADGGQDDSQACDLMDGWRWTQQV